jgi:uncharacterized Zn finger protein
MSEQQEPAPRRSGGRSARSHGQRQSQANRPAQGGRPKRPATVGRTARPAPRARAGAGGVQSGVGEHWWTARWLAALERLGWSMRLQRGQSYARAGSVLRIDVQPGVVTATVKGSQPKPYRVTIRIEPLTDAEWDRVIDALAAQALFAARLLAGEMPPTIEDAFAQAGVTLFPTSAKDLYAACTCPDWANPCKHVAAVHYMLGAEFDRDPFLLFWLRGRSRQQLIEALRARRAAMADEEAGAAQTAAPVEPPAAPAEPPAPAAPPLSECIDHFWQIGTSLAGEQWQVLLPEVPESVLRRLGPPPFWRGEYDVMPLLVDAYRTISREAYALAHPEKPVVRPAPLPERPAVRAPEPVAERPRRQPGRNQRRAKPAGPAAAVPEVAPDQHEATAAEAAPPVSSPASPKRPRRRWWPRSRRGEPPAASA